MNKFCQKLQPLKQNNNKKLPSHYTIIHLKLKFAGPRLFIIENINSIFMVHTLYYYFLNFYPFRHAIFYIFWPYEKFLNKKFVMLLNDEKAARAKYFYENQSSYSDKHLRSQKIEKYLKKNILVTQSKEKMNFKLAINETKK